MADNSNDVAEAASAFAVGPGGERHGDSVRSELGMGCSRPPGLQAMEEELHPPLVEVRHDHCPWWVSEN